jgi:cytochrome c
MFQFGYAKIYAGIFFALCISVALYACKAIAPKSAANNESDTPTMMPAKVLVFSKTKGFYHSSIPAGVAAIMKLGAENNFQVDTTRDANYFVDDSLKHYKTVIFLSTTGNILNADQQVAFERYIEAGGSFVGVHAAADTEYDWPWYNRLVGAYFLSHPGNPNVRKATVDVNDTTHISTRGLPKRWERTDEWYNYKSIQEDLTVLARLDENTYEGGENGDNHPIAWYHDYDGGRAFYTGGGHTDETYAEPLFLKHLLGGIKYAIGKNALLDYSKAYSV